MSGRRLLVEDILWTPPDEHLTGRDIASMSELTVPADEIYANVSVNSAMGLREVVPGPVRDEEIMVLAGGWSLNQFESEIRTKRETGMPLVTTNGAYNWCLERGIRPGGQIVIDPRAFNTRFVMPVIEGCKYFIASQCHPDLVRALPPEQIWLWHAENHRYFVPGGRTVMLRTIPLLAMVGYRKQHIYGFDSCLGPNDEHHGYEQNENDSPIVIDAIYGGRRFRCHGSMLTQAQEFCDMQNMLPDDMQLAVYGDGLIAHIIRTCAELKGK